jgi:hypothetical protein
VKFFSSRFRILDHTYSTSASTHLGRVMAVPGDVDRDGNLDLMISGEGHSDGVRVYTPVTRTLLWHWPGQYMGISLEGIGDINGDTYDDMILCNRYSVEIRLGMTGLRHMAIGNPTGYSYIGFRAADVGDVNNDGFRDIACIAKGRIQYGTTLENGVFISSLTELPLWADGHTISIANGGSVNYHVDVGSQYSGKYYLMLGSLTGVSPGFPLAGHPIPLNWDVWTFLLLTSPNSPLFANSFAPLTFQGEGTATFSILPALLPGYAGLTIDHAALIWDLSNFTLEFVTNPRPVTLVP